ncbi:MAG: 3-hydroxyacyl-CoA dehydrogenase, partial [Pseudomonadota bacterium]
TDGFPADRSNAAAVTFPMIEAGRGGRKYGGGFYDYPAEGPKTLWPGLAEVAEAGRETPSVEEARDRLLYRMSLESLRCLQEGVLETERDGNIGSIFAFGFPGATGGAIQFARREGLERFRARAEDFAARFGDRFAPPEAALRRLAESDALAA